MNKRKYHLKPCLVLLLSFTLLITFFNGTVRAVDDDTPFFAGATGLPNIMFIFDNSDSMQDVPYPRKDGNTLRPSGWEWRRGVKADADGTVAETSSGNADWDYNAYTTQETEITPPPQVPIPMDRLDGGDPSLTSTITKINRYYYWGLIYDENLDWDMVAANFDTYYKYRKIIIRNPDNGDEQIRTIDGYSTSGKYWRVYKYTEDEFRIDYSAKIDIDLDDCDDPPDGTGWCSTYDTANPFTYTIVAGTPGEVTRPYAHSDPQYTGRYLFDANIDWSTIDDATYNSTYKNRLLIITGEGTNAGFTARINGRSQSGKYWYVTPYFPANSDYTTTYKIVGEADDERKASGGNHPASKLYQAKKALKTFLESSSIQSDGRYLLNMGFATYMTARIPRVNAKYYRKIIGTYYIRGYYKRNKNHDKSVYHPSSNSEFEDPWTDEMHTNVSVGYTFDRTYNEGQCDEQTIPYTVTAIEKAPTDPLPGRYRFSLNGGYIEYIWLDTEVASCTVGDLTLADLPEQAGWSKVISGDVCFSNQAVTCFSTGDYYETTYHTTDGDYGYAEGIPRYIDQETLMVTPDIGYYNGSWDCPDCTPDPESGDYTLITDAIAATLINVPVNPSGTLGNIESNIYDNSYFRYPGEGDTDQPHAWSYRKTSNNWVYQYKKSNSKNKSTWSDADQHSNFFLDPTFGNEQANHSGDDQIVFVPLPVYNDSVDNKGDDVSGTNVASILNYISLARVPNTYHYDANHMRYDFTMMPYSSSLPVNTSIYSSGAGTPLAASLKDTKNYYESYLVQDQYSQGGCRDNFVILLTDGLDTCALPLAGSTQAERDALVVQAAQDLYDITINDQSFPVKTYVIGFGLGDESRVTLNAIAAAGGTTEAYFATNVEELVSVLTQDILSDIFSNSYTRSAPVVSRILEDGDQLKIYNTYFDYPIWAGHMNAYLIEDNGEVGEKDPNWTSDCDGDTDIDGDAGCELTEQVGRTVYTVVNGSRAGFETLTPALKTLLNSTNDDIDGNGTGGEDADATEIINYTLDPGYNSGAYAGSRNPDWKLGDIYHSVPVVVTNPKFNVDYAGYGAYKTAQAGRDTMIYVGANDGMLHAFYESNGQERWAWVPNAVLGTLKDITKGHRYSVDLTVKAADIDLSSDGSNWKTIVVSGLRKGGYHYFAIDVTDPDNPLHKWEITDNNMGQTWSTPRFGRLNINGTATSVLFVGGGYSTTENKGNRVYIIRVSDGTVLKEITVGTSTNNVPSEIQPIRYGENQYHQPLDYQTRALVDSKLKGNIEVAYFGDTGGTLWKLNALNADADWNPQLVTLYAPASPRPIFHAPAVATRIKGCTRRFVLFGTGSELAGEVIDGATQDYFYEIEDRDWLDGTMDGIDNDGDGCTDESDEAELIGDGAHNPSWTTSERNNGRFRENWKYTFPLGEKVLSDPKVYRDVVYFTSYQSAGGCAMGLSYLYGLTISRCGDEGGRAGLEIEQEEPNPPLLVSKIALGKSIASSVTIAPPFLYFQKPEGDPDSPGIDKPSTLPLPKNLGKLKYWQELN